MLRRLKHKLLVTVAMWTYSHWTYSKKSLKLMHRATHYSDKWKQLWAVGVQRGRKRLRGGFFLRTLRFGVNNLLSL